MNNCQSCKHWGVNREAILNGVENTTRDITSHCENKDILNSMDVWITNLPSWIVTTIRKDFICHYTFGCVCWEEYKDWEKLWE
jgi:hypothetical protein